MQLLPGYTDYSEENKEKLIEAMLRRRPEGVILTGGVHTPHTRRMLSWAGIPVIETWDVPSANRRASDRTRGSEIYRT